MLDRTTLEIQLEIVQRMFDDGKMEFTKDTTWIGRIEGLKAKVTQYKDRKENNCFDFEFLEQSYPYKCLTQILFIRGGGDKDFSSGSIGLLFFDEEGLKVMYDEHCDSVGRHWVTWTFTNIGIYANRIK